MEKQKVNEHRLILTLPFLELDKEIEVFHHLFCPLDKISSYVGAKVGRELRNLFKNIFDKETRNPAIILFDNGKTHVTTFFSDDIHESTGFANAVISILCYIGLQAEMISDYHIENFNLLAIDQSVTKPAILTMPDLQPLRFEPKFVSKIDYILSDTSDFQKSLIKAFDQTLALEKADLRSARQIRCALEWYNLAFSSTTQEKQILFLSIAFETLLDTPKDTAIVHYIKKIISILVLDDEKHRKIIEDWSENFYTLRSKIVHGEKVTKQDFIFKRNISIVKIGKIIFEECLISRLLLLRLIKDDVGSRLLRQTKIMMLLKTNKERFDEIKPLLNKAKEDKLTYKEKMDYFNLLRSIDCLGKDVSEIEIKYLMNNIKEMPSIFNSEVDALIKKHALKDLSRLHNNSSK